MTGRTIRSSECRITSSTGMTRQFKAFREPVPLKPGQSIITSTSPKLFQEGDLGAVKQAIRRVPRTSSKRQRDLSPKDGYIYYNLGKPTYFKKITWSGEGAHPGAGTDAQERRGLSAPGLIYEKQKKWDQSIGLIRKRTR